MKAVLFYGPQDIRYEETRIKPLEKGEILVKIQAALTCGTDVKTFRRGHPVLIKISRQVLDMSFPVLLKRLLTMSKMLKQVIELYVQTQLLAENVFIANAENIISVKI